MKYRGISIIIATAGLVIVEVVALLTGHNGTMLQLTLASLGGLAGFALARKVPKSEE